MVKEMIAARNGLDRKDILFARSDPWHQRVFLCSTIERHFSSIPLGLLTPLPALRATQDQILHCGVPAIGRRERKKEYAALIADDPGIGND
jgi:hypothetical protein